MATLFAVWVASKIVNVPACVQAIAIGPLGVLFGSKLYITRTCTIRTNGREDIQPSQSGLLEGLFWFARSALSLCVTLIPQVSKQLHSSVLTSLHIRFYSRSVYMLLQSTLILSTMHANLIPIHNVDVMMSLSRSCPSLQHVYLHSQLVYSQPMVMMSFTGDYHCQSSSLSVTLWTQLWDVFKTGKLPTFLNQLLKHISKSCQFHHI